MSVVGLTLGSGAKAIRPRAASAASVATSARTRELGCERSYQAKPAASAGAEDQRTRRAASSRGDLDRQAPRAAARAPSLRHQRPARAPEDARGLGGEVPAAAEHLGGRAVGRDRRRRRAGRRGRRTRRRTRSRGWRRARPPRPRRARAAVEASAPLRPRSIPRVGSSRHTTAGRLAVQHDRQRQPLALAAGEVARVAVGELLPARRLASALGASSSPTRSCDEVVARGSGAAAPRARSPRTRPRVGASRPAAMPQQRRLARAVAAHQRDRLARARRRGRRRAGRRGPSGQLEPQRSEARQTARRRPALGGVAGRAGGSRGGRAARSGRQPVRAQRAPGLLHRRRRRAQAGPGEEAGRRGLERGALRGRPARGTRAAAPSQATPPPVEGDHAVGGGQAALEAVLGEQHRRPPLLVEAAQQPDQLVARDRVELRGRLVEQHQLRAPDERGGQRDALQLAAGQLGGRAVEQVGDARAPAPPPPPRARPPPRPRRGSRAGTPARRARCPSRPASRGPGTASRRRGQLARAVVAGVQAGDTHAPGELAAVEVRHQPAGGAQQRRLPRARQARTHHELARARRPASTSRSAGAGRIGVAVGHAARSAARSSLDPPAVGERRAAPRRAARRRRAPTGAGRQRPATGRPRSRPRPSRSRRSRADDRDRRAGEREVVARPRPRAARGPGAPSRSRALQRRRHVDRAVQRARGARARAPAAARAGRGRQRCASASRRASRPSTGTIRVASAAVSAERDDTRRNRRSTSSGSTAAE